MTNLEQSFRDICARHNLHSVSVGLLIPNDQHGAGWSVSLQRWDGDAPIPGCCWHVSGASIADALNAAIAEIPPADALTDEALPAELAARSAARLAARSAAESAAESAAIESLAYGLVDAMQAEAVS